VGGVLLLILIATLVGTRIGLLVAFTLVCATFAARAFTRYQRSL
jgi:hypothetical protein